MLIDIRRHMLLHAIAYMLFSCLTFSIDTHVKQISVTASAIDNLW